MPVHRILDCTIYNALGSARKRGWRVEQRDGHGLVAITPEGDICKPCSYLDDLVGLSAEATIYLGKSWLFTQSSALDIHEVLDKHRAAGGKVVDP